MIGPFRTVGSLLELLLRKLLWHEIEVTVGLSVGSVHHFVCLWEWVIHLTTEQMTWLLLITRIVIVCKSLSEIVRHCLMLKSGCCTGIPVHSVWWLIARNIEGSKTLICNIHINNRATLNLFRIFTEAAMLLYLTVLFWFLLLSIVFFFNCSSFWRSRWLFLNSSPSWSSELNTTSQLSAFSPAFCNGVLRLIPLGCLRLLPETTTLLLILLGSSEEVS